MKRIQKLLLSMVLLAFLFGNATPWMTIVNANNINFTVQAVIPDNQIDKRQTYFDLMMKPGETQDLLVKLINVGETKITVDVALRAASTNRNGIIEYQVAVPPDETLKVPFNEIATTQSVVVVEAGETKEVQVRVAMPEGLYDGVILGGIIFTKREASAAVSGVAISNRFSYVVGVKLTETDKVIAPDFRLKSIEPVLINYRHAVVANIHNPVPLIVKDMQVDAQIYQDEQGKPLFSANKIGVDMAPNSVFPLPIEWQGIEMEPDDYTLKLKLTYKNKTYDWEEKFTIDSEQAEEMNSNTLDKPVKVVAEANWWLVHWYYWIPILALVLILLFWFAFILGKRRRKEEDDDEQKQ